MVSAIRKRLKSPVSPYRYPSNNNKIRKYNRSEKSKIKTYSGTNDQLLWAELTHSMH
jgi:hypothetical protein